MNEYQVYIRWPRIAPNFDCVIPVKADSFDEAAKKRVDMLITPSDYTHLIVTHGDEARLYEIKYPTTIEVVQV